MDKRELPYFKPQANRKRSSERLDRWPQPSLTAQLLVGEDYLLPTVPTRYSDGCAMHGLLLPTLRHLVL